MYCKNCGAQNSDDAVFCLECGASLEAEAAAEERHAKVGVSQKLKSLSKNKLIGLIAAGVAALAGLIIICALLFGSSWKKTAKGFTQQALKGNWVKAANYYNSKMTNYDIKKNYDGDKNDYKTDLKADGEEFLESLENSDYIIKDVRVVGYKKVDKDDIADMNETLKDIKVSITISDAITAYVRVDYRRNGSNNSRDLEISLIKVGGKWHVANGSLDSIDYSF